MTRAWLKIPRTFTCYYSRLGRSLLWLHSHSHMWSTLKICGECLKRGNRRAKPLTRFEELIANDREVRRQAVAHGENSPDTVRGARAHTAQVKITRVDLEAISAE